jgi:hypothetical protein
VHHEYHLRKVYDAQLGISSRNQLETAFFGDRGAPPPVAQCTDAS